MHLQNLLKALVLSSLVSSSITTNCSNKNHLVERIMLSTENLLLYTAVGVLTACLTLIYMYKALPSKQRSIALPPPPIVTTSRDSNTSSPIIKGKVHSDIIKGVVPLDVKALHLPHYEGTIATPCLPPIFHMTFQTTNI